MINLAPIRAELAATPGDMVAISKRQINALLDDAEAGQQAQRHLKIIGAMWCGYGAGTDVSAGPSEAH